MAIKFEIPSNVDSFTTIDHVVTGTFILDGFTINPSGAVINQVLQYNGSSFVAATIATGGTLASDYNAGSSAADQTLLIQAAKGGPVIIKSNSGGIGTLLQVKDSSNATIMSLNDNSTLSFVSRRTTGGDAFLFNIGTYSNGTTWKFGNDGNTYNILDMQHDTTNLDLQGVAITGAVFTAKLRFGDNATPLIINTGYGTYLHNTATGDASYSRGVVVDTTYNWTNAASRLLTLKTVGVEKFGFCGDGGFQISGGTAAVSSASTGRIRYNSSTNHLEFSENGGAYTAFGSGGGGITVGNTVNGGTSKSVLFVDGSGNLAQDNSFFAWDVSTHYLGLGIGSPLYSLDVHNTSDVSAFHLRTGASSDDGFYINSGASGGATISVGAKNTGGGIWQARSTTAGFIDIQSYGFGYYFNTGLTIGNNFTPSRKLLIDTSGNILIGDSSATVGKLQVETQDSTYGQIQIINTSSDGEASISFISGATAIGSSPTSANGANHIWAIGAGAWGVGGNKFGMGNTAAGNSFITLDGDGYRLGVGLGNTSPATTLDIGNTGTTASLALRSGSTASVSSSNTGRMRYNESTQHFEISENGGAYSQVASASPTIAEKANASNTQITTTSATDVITFTPISNGNFQVNVYYRVATATTNVTMIITWTDSAAAQTQTLVAVATSTVVGSYILQPVYINATTGGAITVTATAGTANNLFVSASIIGIT